MSILKEHDGYVDTAFNEYWSDKIGRYDPIKGTDMQPYKKTTDNVAQACIKVPAAGGKTFIAVNALQCLFSKFDSNQPKCVVWLVLWNHFSQSQRIN